METKKVFGKDFMLVIIGQIISLFGNQILRYAMPLYLLNETGSAFLFGVTMALSFVPMLLLAPVGGIVADRINKRNIMVGLDFTTAIIVTVYCILYRQMNLIAITIVVLMILYGIQGLYQPTVQASVPMLVAKDNLTQGNAMITMVQSLAGILGPVIGGMTYAKFGIQAILYTAIVCFIFSAVMEIFIKIPHVKQENGGSILAIAKADMKAGMDFIIRVRPETGKVSVLLLVINAVFSALIVVGLPVVINSKLGFETDVANTLYGYAQGALALGGLAGGMLSGILGKRINIKKGAALLLGCTLTILPMAVMLAISATGYLVYAVIVVCCVFMMIFSTVLSIILVTYVQIVTPMELLGKVMALLSCLVMCGHPIGQLIYGYVLERFADRTYLIFSIAFVLAALVTLIAHKIFRRIAELEEDFAANS
ncbi:MAG: MFS transporter [bacterium]|nr:MFS transporter [bacterium]